MNVATMRRVDAWLGVPLCAVLTAWRALTAPFARRAEGAAASILFVKLAEQGSTVLAYPAMRRAARMVGKDNVYFLVFDQNRAILDAMDVVRPDNIIEMRTTSLPVTFLSALAAVWRMRRLRLGAAIDLEFFARSTALFTYLSGAERRIGLHAFAGGGPWRGDLLTHRIQYNAHVHTSQLFDLLVRAVAEPAARLPALDLQTTPLTELEFGTFSPSEQEVEQVRATVRDVTGEQQVPRLVLLNANCSDLLPLRRWREERYAQLARRLLDADPELWVAFTGAPAEAPPVAELVASIGEPRCVSLAGHTTMPGLLVLYGLAEVLVTNDSGPAHFASVTSIDVVTLFGPETPRLFGVVSPRSHVMWAETACSPCVTAYNNRVSKCTDNVCMDRITVDTVFETVANVLAHRRRTAAGEVQPRREPPVAIPLPPRAPAPARPAPRP